MGVTTTAEPEASTAPATHTVVELVAETTVPTTFGPLVFRAFRETATGTEHLAISSGTITSESLVRVHSECITGEAFGSLKCDCGPQLDAALALIASEGGTVIYLRGHEGRGIGLGNKLRAYRMQEHGLDTVDANRSLGLPDDARDYTAAAEILDHLGIRDVHLLTNNPDKIAQLRAHGITVTERVPLVVGVQQDNLSYLQTKHNRMGHLLENVG